jgi:hypothetical protein
MKSEATKISKNKKRRPLTDKQKVFVKTLSDTLDPTTAQMTAYHEKDKKTAASRVGNTMKSPGIKDFMNSPKIGLSDEYLLSRLKRALLAKRLVWSKTREDWLEEVDWATQVKALEIAFRLKGHLNTKAPELDTAGVKEINVTFNLVKARSIDEIARLTDQTSIAKGRLAVVEKPIEAEIVEADDKDIQRD